MKNRIKELRKKSGITQKQLSEELGIPTNTLSQYENDERTPKKIDIWERIADFFDVSIAYLLCLSEDEQTYNYDEIQKNIKNRKYMLDTLKSKMDKMENILKEMTAVDDGEKLSDKEREKSLKLLAEYFSEANTIKDITNLWKHDIEKNKK